MDGDITRRDVLRFTGAAGVAACLAGLIEGAEPVGLVSAGEPLPDEGFVLRRREDMLNLRVRTRNIELAVRDGRTVLMRVSADEDAYLVVEFGPQHVMEQAYDAGPPTGPPAGSRLAGPSRLAFKVTDRLPFPFTASALLNWEGWSPRLVEHAVTGSTTAPRAPRDDETALELPWRMLISPDEHGRWAHRTGPVTHDGWTELWHTRLRPDSAAAGALVRAVWLTHPRTQEWIAAGTRPAQADEDTPFTTALELRRQFDIVRLSSDGRLRGDLPTPVRADRLMLSGLGAWYDLHGVWDKPDPADHFDTDLAEWQQRGTMGRDHYIRTVDRGCLFPFGHRAVLITITEREFGDGTGGARGAAFLRRRAFVVPVEREKVYEGDPAMPDGQRALPFRRIRVLTDTTPEIAKEPLVGTSAEAVIPTVGGEWFPFQFNGTDWAGQDVPFSCPIVFVSDSAIHDDAFRGRVIAAYASYERPAGHRLDTIDLAARKVALAEPGKPGDTTLTVQSISFGGDHPATADLTGSRPVVPVYPRMTRCEVHLPEAAALVGRELRNVALEYFTAHLRPQGENLAGVFLQSAKDAATRELDYAVDRVGGLANPQTAINGFAREIGPVVGQATTEAEEIRKAVEDAALGRLDTARAFGDALKAKILGALPLTEILERQQKIEQSVHLVKRELTGPRRVESTMDWKPVLKNSPNKLFEATPPGRDRATLELHAKTVVTQEGTSVSGQYTVRGELRGFNVNLWGTEASTHFITLEFGHLRFTSAQNGKPDLECEVGNVTFHGALSFVRELSKYISFGPAQRSAAPARKPLNVNVDATGIRAELSLNLPPLALGFFSLDGVALGAGVTIPFTGRPLRVDFRLSSRERPFHLLIYGFGGGGFVGLALTGSGVDLLEFSFEFGAGVALDLGVASGAVSLMAGIYFRCGQLELPRQGQECLLSAYLRLNGALSVLGLITLSLEFYLSLTYQSSNGALVGYARMTVSIEIAFFSKDVTLEIRRELAGSGPGTLRRGRDGAPRTLTFGDVHTFDQWDRYQAAFAPAGG